MNYIDPKKLPEFDGHKLVTYIHNSKTGLDGFIAIHRISREYPSFGATRVLNYQDPERALRDALRLSKTMSFKAALAGLRCGGAKAVIISKFVVNKSALLRSYADEVGYFKGSFVTGADVGIEREDVVKMRRFCRYFVGTKVDPVRFTGLGLLYSIQACLRGVFGSESIENRSFAIQGVGKVGSELLRLIYPKAGKVYITDINKGNLRSLKKKYPKVRVVLPDEIYDLDVDILSPCALGNCLNRDNVNNIKCKIVAGGANCQLENDEIGTRLHKRGILYAPDYLINSGGLISVYSEYEDVPVHLKKIIKKVKKIKLTMGKIIDMSVRTKKPPFIIANQMSEKIINKLY